jgi:hypothetical protein
MALISVIIATSLLSAITCSMPLLTTNETISIKAVIAATVSFVFAAAAVLSALILLPTISLFVALFTAVAALPFELFVPFSAFSIKSDVFSRLFTFLPFSDIP